MVGGALSGKDVVSTRPSSCFRPARRICSHGNAAPGDKFLPPGDFPKEILQTVPFSGEPGIRRGKGRFFYEFFLAKASIFSFCSFVLLSPSYGEQNGQAACVNLPQRRSRPPRPGKEYRRPAWDARANNLPLIPGVPALCFSRAWARARERRSESADRSS